MMQDLEFLGFLAKKLLFAKNNYSIVLFVKT